MVAVGPSGEVPSALPLWIAAATGVAGLVCGWMAARSCDAATRAAPTAPTAPIDPADEESEWETESASSDEGSSDDDYDDDRVPLAVQNQLREGGAALEASFPDAECKMVILVRRDLKMEKGKIGAQCGHATLGCYKLARAYQPRLVRRWEDYGQTKVCLRIDSEEEMDLVFQAARANGLVAVPIRDAGRTQVAPGTRTVLGIGPAPKPAIDAVTGHLKLL